MDKIELNRKMNATLEAMARALFRDWVRRFRPHRAKDGSPPPLPPPDLWPSSPTGWMMKASRRGWRLERSMILRC